MHDRLEALGVNLGENLGAARRFRGWSVEQAAERIGITTLHYRGLEQGQIEPSLALFVRVVFALEVSSDSLLGLEAPRLLSGRGRERVPMR